MASLFSKPKIPTPEAAKPAPTVDEARVRTDDMLRNRQRRGRAATQLVASETNAAKVLTGN